MGDSASESHSSGASVEDHNLSSKTEGRQEGLVSIRDGVLESSGIAMAYPTDKVCLVPALRTIGAEPAETWRLARVFNSERGSALAERDECLRISNGLYMAVAREK